jgi:acyl-CoA thioester hydrolase
MNKLIPCYRGAVDAWECDQMGHMNVQFYMAKVAEAFGHLQNSLGLSPEVIRQQKKGLRFKDLRIQYKAEVHAGSILHGLAGIRRIEGDNLIGFIHLFDTAFNRLSSAYEFTVVYTDLDQHTPLPLPSFLRDAADQMADNHPNMYQPAPFAGSMMPAKPLANMFESARSSVDVWECDIFKHVEMRHVIGYFSDAATHILGAVGLTREAVRDRNLGSAALDYYSEFHAPVRMSSPIALKSGLMGAEGKIFRFGHNLVNLDTNEIAVTTTVLGCYFDMTARKSVPLPEEFTSYPQDKLLAID